MLLDRTTKLQISCTGKCPITLRLPENKTKQNHNLNNKSVKGRFHPKISKKKAFQRWKIASVSVADLDSYQIKSKIRIRSTTGQNNCAINQVLGWHSGTN